MLKYKISEVKPRIFFLNFQNQYDCNMMFLRYQEFYESPNSKFRGKPFKIFDFMRWYSKKFGKGAFTYPVDWAGFNIPSSEISKLFNLMPQCQDGNFYDVEMDKVYSKCLKKYPDGKFYLIAAVGKSKTLRHEVAHGLFYLHPEYQKEMKQLVGRLRIGLRKKIEAWLKRIGYTPKVYVDECQAYLATGFPDGVAELVGLRPQENAEFIRIYQKYTRKK